MPCIADFNVDSCDVRTAVLINLVPREFIKLLFLHQFGNPIADFSNLANCLSSCSRCFLLMFNLAIQTATLDAMPY